MKAYIRVAKGSNLEVEVSTRLIDKNGYVRIEDDCGVIYETHLCNVIFVEGNV